MLEEFVVVFGGYKLAGGVDDVADVLYEALAFRRECGYVDGRVVVNVFEGAVDLSVVWDATLTESLDGAIETELHRAMSDDDDEDVKALCHTPFCPCQRPSAASPSRRRRRR